MTRTIAITIAWAWVLFWTAAVGVAGLWYRYAPVIALSLAVVLVLTWVRIAASGYCP